MAHDGEFMQSPKSHILNNINISCQALNNFNMPGALTNYSMVYPGVLSENTENAKLQTMFLTIEFSGRLPRHLSERSIVST